MRLASSKQHDQKQMERQTAKAEINKSCLFDGERKELPESKVIEVENLKSGHFY